MTSPTTVVEHTGGICPVCTEPYPRPDGHDDRQAVDHLLAHPAPEVAYALLIAQGHAMLMRLANEEITRRGQQLVQHLDDLAAEQHPGAVGPVQG